MINQNHLCLFKFLSTFGYHYYSKTKENGRFRATNGYRFSYVDEKHRLLAHMLKESNPLDRQDEL